MYRIHISVLKATKKKPTWQDSPKKKTTTWQDSQRIQVEFSIRFYRLYGKLHIYTRFNQLEKNDSYKTFGLVAVLRLCDLLVFSSGWYIYEIAMNRIALFRWFKDNASSLKDNILKKTIGFRPQVYQQLDSARKPQASLFEIEFHLSSKLKNNIDIWFAIKPSTWNNEPNGTHISNQECLYILFGISREQFRFPVNHQTHLFYVYIYIYTTKLKIMADFVP